MSDGFIWTRLPTRLLVMVLFLSIQLACAAPDEPSPQAPEPAVGAPESSSSDPSPESPEPPESPESPESPVAPPQRLTLGAMLELKDWVGGETRSFYFETAADEVVAGAVAQHGIDVEIELRDPAGEVLVWVDTPVGASGSETFFGITETEGRHTLRVHAFGKGALDGTVDVRWTEHRPAAAQDRVAAEALGLGSEAERLRLRLRRDPELKLETLDAFRRAMDRWSAAENLPQVGRMLMEMGAIHWRYGAEQEAAERFLAEAWPLLALDDASYRARLRHYQGEMAVAAGRPSEAREHYAAAADLWPAAQAGNLAGTLNNLGFIEHRLGRPQRALVSYEHALELWHELGVDFQEARTSHNLGKMYLWLGDLDRARGFLDRAADHWQRLENDRELASTWMALGQVESRSSRFDAARKLYQQALELAMQVGDRRLEGHLAADLGTLEMRAGQGSEAMTWFRRAVERLQATGSSKELGRAYSTLSRFLLEQGELDEASRLAAKARDTAQSVQDPLDMAGFAAVSAEIAQAAGDHRRAMEWARSAVARVEEIRARPTDLEHRATFLAAYLGVYESAIEVAATGDDGALEALRWAERSKGRSLLDEVAVGQGDWGELTGPGTLGDLHALAAGRILLLYFLGDRASYVWRVDGRGAQLFELAPRLELERDIRRLYGLLSESPRLELKARRRQALRQLSRALLPEGLLPEDLLPGPDGDSAGESQSPRLHIVADGAMHYVPFSILLGPDARSLIESFEIAYAPSLSVLRHLEDRRMQRTPAPRDLLVVADPVYDDDPRCPDGVLESAGGTSTEYRRLPGTAEEAAWLVARGADVELLSGFEARGSAVHAAEPGRFRRLHFAVHGELGTRFGARPRLVLAQRNRGCAPDPSFLDMAEVSTWSLSSDLVVLGACKSGLGRDLRGEGLLGMTRALLQAGSSQVVVALWDVDDDIAGRWTRYFYQALETESAAAALRRAQLRLQTESGDDGFFFWAPFVLFGAADP